MINKFMTEEQHKVNLQSQSSMSPQTVKQLRNYGVTEVTRLKLEFFFYTNSPEKAESLSNELDSMGYTSEYGESADNKSIQLVTGWTSPIIMTSKAVKDWTIQMCNLGFSHDCEFDGWGTNPEQ